MSLCIVYEYVMYYMLFVDPKFVIQILVNTILNTFFYPKIFKYILNTMHKKNIPNITGFLENYYTLIFTFLLTINLKLCWKNYSLE